MRALWRRCAYSARVVLTARLEGGIAFLRKFLRALHVLLEQIASLRGMYAALQYEALH